MLQSLIIFINLYWLNTLYIYKTMDYSIQKGKTIILKSSRKVRQVRIENILYISCDSYLISVYFYNQKEPEIFLKPLIEIEKELADYHFLRINRNELINMRYFKSYQNREFRKIILSTGKTLFVSRRKWSAIKKYF